MGVRYHVVSNSLKPGMYSARVIQGRRVTLDAMITNICARTSLSPSDIRGAVMALIEETRSILAAGDTAVIDGLATFTTSISGSFASPDVMLSRESAQLNLSIQADSRLVADVTANTSFERQVLDIKAPIIKSFFDATTSSFDAYIPGSIVRLMGNNLKFNPARADEGVFLRGEAEETRLTVYSTVGKRQVDALLPPTINGTRQVIVRTRYTPNGELREGRLPRMVSEIGT